MTTTLETVRRSSNAQPTRKDPPAVTEAAGVEAEAATEAEADGMEADNHSAAEVGLLDFFLVSNIYSRTARA